MLIFPAIDLFGGKAVRLMQGRRDTVTLYSERPWELASAFAVAGVTRLHVVDLDAAFTGGVEHNRPIIKRIMEDVSIEVEVGGGVRSLEDCDRLFDLGATHAVMGTAAVKTPEVTAAACAKYPRRIIVAVDAREGNVAIEGWTEATEQSALDLGEAAARAGAAAILYTDIGRDGMRTGPDVDHTARLARHIAPCPVIASGGVATLDDIDAAARTGAFAVIVGKALYEKAFTIEEAIQRASRPPS